MNSDNKLCKKETVSREIAKNIILHTSKMGLKNTEDLAHTLYTYTLDVKEVSLVEITLDFTGGQNIKLENQEGFVAKGVVKPMSSSVIAVIRAYDVTWSTPCKIKMAKRSPTIEEQEQFIKGDVDQLKQDIQKAEENYKNFPLKNCTHEELLKKLKTTGTNFVDINFKPSDRSVFDPEKGQGFDRKIHWRRPKDFMVPDPSKGIFEPQVFDKEIEPGDILQGQLGDCWFLCACACLAEMPQLIERLFLVKDYNEEGIYRVKICKNGEWREVIIDDYFPCFPNGQPMFSKGHGNELWVLILEKAYSKIHGCYKNIVGGNPFEAMMDLTGCPTASFSFSDEGVQQQIKSGKLWQLIKHYDKSGYLMSGGTPGEDMFTESGKGADKKGGLIPGHAYSVISAMEYKNIKLLKIRNPWGQFEWDGDWSDKSNKWTEEYIRAFNPVLDEDDGTFWMSFDDFVSNFDSLDVCRIENWDELRIRGRFIRYNDISDPDNEVVVSKWFYALEVPARTHLVVGLHQEDERIQGTLPRRQYIDFGLAIIKRDSQEGSTLLDFKDYVMSRDCEIEIVLEPGSYIVVPRTTGCAIKRPNDADEQEKVNSLLDEEGKPNEMFLSTIIDIFKKFDLVISNSIDYKEFSGFFEIVGKKITELDFKNTILQKYCSYNGELTQLGFKDWFIDQVKAEGEEKIFEWLLKLGYDRDLYSIRSRLFTITFHSKTISGNGQMEVKIRDAIGTDIDNVVTRLILENHGKDIERGEGYRIMQFESPAIFSWTFGYANDSDHPIIMNLDLSQSENLLVSTKGPIAKRKTEPKQCAFLMHAQAGFGSFNKNIQHKVEHLPRKK